LLLLSLLFEMACGPPRGPQTRPVGGLEIVCEPEDALLYVDDKYLGTASGLKIRPLKLAAGPHRIELRREGYFTHFAEVTITTGVRQKLRVKLRKEPF
jgi:hypothetical protein